MQKLAFIWEIRCFQLWILRYFFSLCANPLVTLSSLWRHNCRDVTMPCVTKIPYSIQDKIIYFLWKTLLYFGWTWFRYMSRFINITFYIKTDHKRFRNIFLILRVLWGHSILWRHKSCHTKIAIDVELQNTLFEILF